MSDHLGIFGRDEGETGELDVRRAAGRIGRAARTEPDPAAPAAASR